MDVGSAVSLGSAVIGALVAVFGIMGFAYLSPRKNLGTLEGADFFQANLSGGSLKSAHAAKAIYYQARLRETVFRGADLRNANFFRADLTDAVFTGAALNGASFAGAHNIPPGVDAERWR